MQEGIKKIRNLKMRANYLPGCHESAVHAIFVTDVCLKRTASASEQTSILDIRTKRKPENRIQSILCFQI